MNHEQQYWDRLAKNYDRSMRLLGGPMPRMLGLTADAVAGSESVLEVAAGTGLVTAAIAPRVGKLVATDYAQAMVDVLRHRVEATGLTNVECMRADLYALPFEAGTFDAVVAANVLHLVPDLPHALKALTGVLRPGGKLIVPTFCHDETRVSWALSRIIALTGFPGHRRFTAASLREALKSAGVRFVHAETVPGMIPIAFVHAQLEDEK
jgi:phosphatidylethanolamine/phosphatidyl-N-methylethanolamine N-methyltransferase